jgi:cell division cycle protein 20 (cofactor of APC complex)
MSNIAEFESMLSLENPIKSSVVPRWQRKQQQQQMLSDRFIPTRLNEAQGDHLTSNHVSVGSEDNEYSRALEGVLGQGSDDKDARVLAYKQKPPMPQEGYQNSLKVLYSQSSSKRTDTIKSTRHISSAPTRILDAPDMIDDYYLNLLSWSCNNALAVALNQSVYLWDASTGGIQELMNVDSTPDDYISSVAWREGGHHIAIGTNSNCVQLWDAASSKQLRSLEGHGSRIGALSWNPQQGSVLTSGSRDTTIITHDVRIANHMVGVTKCHSQEVCGLAWSPDGSYLASGANDNTLCIMDAAAAMSFNGGARHVLTDHQAAVKALAWSPHERNLLVSSTLYHKYTSLVILTISY